MSKKQPKLVLNRNHILTTRYGHSIRFIKDKPIHVPRLAYNEAIGIGAVPEDGADPNVLDDDNKKTAPVDPIERGELINVAILELMDTNDREDFTASGSPKVDSVSKKVDFKVDQREIQEQFKAIQEAQVAAKEQEDADKAASENKDK
jgi:hypothetical protein